MNRAPRTSQRLGELVRFDTIRGTASQPGLRIVFDALHGCGAGYLDRVLAEHGIAAQTIRAGRDVLFDGTGPDVSESNLAPLCKAVTEASAEVGLATDGDADRFGIVDGAGRWVSPNHILGLLYDYLIETRGWRLDAARSVATSHLLDGVAARNGLAVHETPVGFKYIGQWILQGRHRAGRRGERRAFDSRAPARKGRHSGLPAGGGDDGRAARYARRAAPRSFPARGPRILAAARESALARGRQGARRSSGWRATFRRFLGRRVARADRTDGLKLVFDDGSWVLLRLSGTEPLMRVYTEAATQQESARSVRRGPRVDLVRRRSKSMSRVQTRQPFWRRHLLEILGLALLALGIHDVFGAHGYLAMRRSQKEIEQLRGEIERLNQENHELGRSRERAAHRSQDHRTHRARGDGPGAARGDDFQAASAGDTEQSGQPTDSR